MSDATENTATEAQANLRPVTPELVEAVAVAMREGRSREVRELVGPLSPPDMAWVLEQLSEEERQRLLDLVNTDLDPEVLVELDESVRDSVIEHLGHESVAAAAAELDSDDAVDIIGDLDEADREQVLAAMPAEDRAEIEQALAYDEDTAGRMMQRELVAVPQKWSVGEVIDYLRESADELPEDFYDVIVVDDDNRPVGTVALGTLVRTKRPVLVADIMQRDLYTLPVDTTQEEVAHLFRDQNLISAPVVDAAGKLVGMITVDDVVDVIDEEAEKDIMGLAGAGEADIYSDVKETVRARLPWLGVNLITALISSTVIALFEDEIKVIVALAILAPIVASMGGNAGTQTLAVAVRALATQELTARNALRFIGKEVVVGSLNGIALAAVVGSVAWVWFGEWRIGAIIGAAVVANLVAACFSGTVIPLTLNRMKVDPAVSSGVFLTTVTDVVGFFAFLGLA
ncbi:MAG: magnesium transporter, partial [Reyranellaceae bacterium]